MTHIAIKEILQSQPLTKSVNVKGWVRTKRGSKEIAFIAMNDGSTIHHLQVVVDKHKFDESLLATISTGACLSVIGKIVASQGQGQGIELQAEDIEVYGSADPVRYPLQKKGHSLEFLREIAHLRPRTNTFGAVMRIRHAMAFALHTFYHERGFYYMHTPIITGSDCEGAGEMFRVTTLDPKNPPTNKKGNVDFKQDFFGRDTYLTVSGQLEGELGALALSKIYTFGPTFRAENSNTTRHISEFWMNEPEMAFYDITDNMDLAEEFLKYLVNYALNNCADDIQFLNDTHDEHLISTLESVTDKVFERITYTSAVDILLNAEMKFEFPLSWGTDLQAEHEKYLVEKHFKKPVIITDYPKSFKAFYMKLNEDDKTVRGMDVLFPRIGEIIGGSQREERMDVLKKRIAEAGIEEKNVWWYLETRQYGTAPHSGFGLGFERFLMFVTGMTNIRDVIPFPRTPKSAEF